MAQFAEHLVGRAAEVGSFGALLDGLEEGRSAAIAVIGEPGIGKTRLLAELAAEADRRQQLVLSGAASELEQDVPFWVFVDAIEEYVEGLEPKRLAGLADDVRAELALVFPSLFPPAKDGHGAVQNERYRSHRAVRELLEVLTQNQGVVLVLDDLHWADRASIELVGSLLSRPASAPVLVALGVRPHQMPERLASSLGRAQRAGTLERIELGALTWQDAQVLLGEAIRGSDAETIYEESGGNPFYLEQLARMRVRSGTTTPAAGEAISLGGVRVPPTVAGALAEELALLSGEARRVLEGAAVAGDPFDPELVAAAAELPEAATLDALDELLRLDLVRHTDVPRRFRFRHPLVRRAVYEATPGGWRLGAHERCADWLLAREAPASARAHHVELAARQGDAAAVATLREAGEAAALRAPASAALWFEAALRLLPASAPPEERVELLMARAGSLGAIGQIAESHAALLECLEIVPEGSTALRVRLTAACAGLEQLLGRHPEAHARLERALAELHDPDSPEAVALMIELAVDGLFGTDFDSMREWASRAQSAATPLGDRTLLAGVLAVRAAGEALAGTAVDAQARCEEAAAVIDALSDDELARRLDALSHLATAEVYLDRFEPASRHAERALAIGRATGQGDLFPLIYMAQGTSLWVQGRVAESCEAFDGAIEGARLLGNDLQLAWYLLNRSCAAFAGGDMDTALATAEESVALARELDGSGPVSSWAAVTLAMALLEKEEAARAAELLVASAGGEELRALGGGWRARGLELLTRCLLRAGKRAEAERAAAAARACAETVGLPMAAAMAGLAEAALDLDAGEHARASERALDSAAALEEVGDAFDAAMARMLAGRALALAGEPDRAAAELERAAAAFESFPAPRYVAEAERELRKLGRRIHHRTRAGKADELGVSSLTERELEVARLIVDRKTNPEIAAALFLSQKTVETHIRNMFRKVGVASRVELARAVEQADRSESALAE
jgi:DNA-binding CsgD family transcriptional regulator